MEAKINDDELRLLVWLHENVTGFNNGCGLDADAVAMGAGLSGEVLKRSLTYLDGHGFVGFKAIDMSNRESKGQATEVRYVWLTSFGENYIRNVETAPGVAQRLTMAALAKLGNVATTTATTVFTELLKQHLRPIA